MIHIVRDRTTSPHVCYGMTYIGALESTMLWRGSTGILIVSCVETCSWGSGLNNLKSVFAHFTSNAADADQKHSVALTYVHEPVII